MPTVPSRSTTYRAPSRSRVRRRAGFAAAVSHQRGFTLMEILVVLALIAAISAVLLGTIGGGIDGLRLRSAANDIASELRRARAQAMAKGEVQKFVIDPAQRRWSSGAAGDITDGKVGGQTDNETGSKANNKANSNARSETREGELPKKSDVVFVGARELQPRRGQGAIVFFEDGASSGGRIQLRQGKAAWNIDVAWLTGEVGVHRARAVGTRLANADDNASDDEAAAGRDRSGPR